MPRSPLTASWWRSRAERPRRGQRRTSRRRLASTMIVVTVLVAALPLGASVAQALAAPGQASTSVRLVEWVRDHGGAGLVNVAEDLWYARNRPGAGAPDPSTVPAAAPVAPAPPPAGPPALPTPHHPTLPAEARWTPPRSVSTADRRSTPRSSVRCRPRA